MTTKAWSCLLALCLLLASGCGTNTGNQPVPAPNQTEPEPVPAPAPGPEEAPEDPVTAQLNAMSLEEKLGQLVIFGLEGTSLQQETREMMDRYKVGGFIFYQDNIEDMAQTASLVNELKEANREQSVPLFLGIDQEGGRVDRMPADVTSVPSPRMVAEQDDKRYSYASGLALGTQVRALGLNLDFAPVLDVNSNPNNPVIGDRAYGDVPEQVIRHGLEAMEGIRSARVIPVVKHFPGHGDTDVDSHLDLPVIHKSQEELKKFELKPFEAAVESQADAVMVAHLLIPDLDETYPASLSRAIINDLLREEMGYEGVIMTDDLTMKGITKHRTVGEAAVLSLQAGSDIVLIGHHHGQQAEVMEALKASLDNGQLSLSEIDAKAARVLRLKQAFQLTDDPVEAIAPKALNEQIETILSDER
ncbi:beta-N-acetylhexosaminidase [Paenibacillus daejeonensis]|uniref:beta-N-acetylhexosaminidase n=1 Tax=Paenibacillus daejeonensis TaxID=135193 RepID=UPI00037768ED|nr:beta-N-acetylhexosaminidase [Paenibacillus daejeonensis]